jgi:hypothetical protein
MASIQLPIPSPLITSGDFTAEVRDPGSGAPTQVIRTEDAWSVYTEWNVKGPAVAILDDRLEGDLGVEMVTPAVLVPYSTGSLSGVYPNEKMSFSASVPFAAGTPPLGGQPDVPYHVTALLTFITPGATPGPFAAVVDLGLIQIFDSPLP